MTINAHLQPNSINDALEDKKDKSLNVVLFSPSVTPPPCVNQKEAANTKINK